jgi:ABC-type transporter MlaC component
LVPVIVGSWPSIVGAVTGAAAALGFVVQEAVKEVGKSAQSQQQTERVELEIDNSQIAGQLQSNRQIILTKGDVRLVVSRDHRGRFTVCAEAKGMTKAELEQIARQFAQKVTQCFVYDKVMRELKAKNFHIVSEEVMADEAIRINVRRFVD